MHLVTLDINNVRNLSDIHLNCCPNINLLTGKNAAGKTAVLESIHILSWATSFRTHRISDVIQHGKENLVISAQIYNKNNKIITGLEKSSDHTNIRYNGKKILKRSEQAKNLPVITFTTESHRLLYGAPRERRHWLDWLLFHVEHNYMQDWYRYHHALRQRNALLRATSDDEMYSVWEEEMAVTAETLWEKRNRYMEDINQTMQKLLKENAEGMKIRLKSQYETREIYKKKLNLNRNKDINAGHTQRGPHREDVIFEMNGIEAGKFLSRGEGKQFVLYLLIAHSALQKARTGQQPLLLIDDLQAELDPGAKHNVLNLLDNYAGQVFITSTGQEEPVLVKSSLQRFHVEHGKIMKVVE